MSSIGATSGVASDDTGAPAHVSVADAFKFWLKLGFISFGGPTGQIAIMHRELVDRRRWISDGRFLHALNYCMLLPGPEATQLAIYIGWLMHGTLGGVMAGVLFVVPGVCLLIALSWIYMVYGQVPLLAGLLYGFKAAVVALVLGAVMRLGTRVLHSVAAVILACLSFIAMTFDVVPFPIIVLMAGLAGWLALRVNPKLFPSKAHGSKAQSAAAAAPAILDDDTPPPDHAQVNRTRLMMHTLIFAVMLGTPVLLLSWIRGYDDVFARIARFFTLAAFVTIGGAYAVLPYVQHMVSGVYRWLTPEQMMDGLALGETTPGPLILVLTYVGFVAGWNQTYAQLGIWGALAGAIIATYCTFVPSFMFILLGAPFIERSRGNIDLGVILSAVTAAVVGVIMNMAVVFGQRFILPAHHLDYVAILSIAICFAGLQWRKWNTITTILACGAAGVILKYAGYPM